MSQFVMVNNDYKQRLVENWAPIMEDVEGVDKVAPSIKESLAQVLDNTFRDLVKGGFNPELLKEAAFDNAIDTNLRNDRANAITPRQQDWKQGDVRIPLAVIPLARRMFTQLLAHEVVGVQAMASPSGYVAAYRYVYGDTAGKDAGKEIVWGAFKPEYSGATDYYAGDTGVANDAALSDDVKGALATFGMGTRVADGKLYITKAAGMDVADGENVSFNPGEGEKNIARVRFELEKKLVAAKTRKIGTSISMEDAEDALVSLGLDVNESMINILATDIKNEKDRELIQEIVMGCIGTADKAAKSLSTWDASTADGIDQMSRLSTLYTHILLRSKKIQFNTKMGNGANWMIASSPAAALVERIGDWKLAENDMSLDGAAIAYAGTLRRGSIKVYNDALTEDPYILLGWKGSDVTQTGVVYAPYVETQLLSAPDTDKFGARLMARTRYAIVNSLWGTENFYQLIRLANIDEAAIDASAKKVFATV